MTTLTRVLKFYNLLIESLIFIPIIILESLTYFNKTFKYRIVSYHLIIKFK